LQRETAILWFAANLKPYDLTGGVYFTFGVAGRGFGQAPFAPSPLTATEVLDQEFDGVVGHPIRRAVAQTFPGQWMWDELDASLEILPQPRPDFDSRRALLAHLDTLTGALRTWPHDQVVFGHNGPPDTEPFSPEERDDALSAIGDAKQAIEQDGEQAKAKFEQAWARVRPLLSKLSGWLMARGDDFCKALATSAGEAVGKKLPWLVIVYFNSSKIWHEIDVITKLAEHFLK
jgi:hypothetical protein